MKYQVSELLADKALRDSIIEEAFVFTDEYNDFFAVDFGKESWRYNHITVFEVLYSLGGDELFEKLIAAGGTCLTKDPNAAKVGVQPVGGAEGYYLKTNASAGVAFLSILNGLAGLGDDERFSFYVTGYSTAALRVADKEYNYCTQYEYFCNYEVREQEDGRYVIYDCEEETEVAFCIVTNKVEEEISSFYALEPLYKYEESLTDDGNILAGYRYKAEESSNWGWLSAELSQITPPEFHDIYVTDKNMLVAGEVVGFEDDTIPAVCVYFEKTSWGIGENILDMSCGYIINELLPQKGYVDRISVENNKEFIYYNVGDLSCRGYVFLSGKPEFPQSPITGKRVKLEAGFLVGEGSSRKIPMVHSLTHVCNPGAKDFYNLYSPEAPEHNAEFFLISDKMICAVKRDGFYAAAKYRKRNDDYQFGSSSDVLEFEELLTPYAFTGIECRYEEDYFILDRFGKKGVYSYKTRAYIIPCEYEEIENYTSDTFRVSKAGFTGLIGVTEEGICWKEKLHRED